MVRVILYLIVVIFSSCVSVKYYVVRHAEKATTSDGVVMNTPNDPPLSSAGKVRAIELGEVLKSQKIMHIYSTNTIRTISTAQPLSDIRGIKIELYDTKDSHKQLIENLKVVKKGNSLIVGHSNTIDDIVNKLYGEIKVPKDLPDSEYDNLYLIIKKGKKMIFENKTFGTATN